MPGNPVQPGRLARTLDRRMMALLSAPRQTMAASPFGSTNSRARFAPASGSSASTARRR